MDVQTTEANGAYERTASTTPDHLNERAISPRSNFSQDHDGNRASQDHDGNRVSQDHDGNHVSQDHDGNRVSQDHDGNHVQLLDNTPQNHPIFLSVCLKPFLSMFLLMSGGTLVAVGQHLFYSYVNGKDVQAFLISQDWVIRIGTGFAFLFHLILVPTIAVAYAHLFWYSVRRRPLTVRTLDGLFILPMNPLGLFSLELLYNTTMLWAVAGVTCLIPIASIMSPGALTVVNTLTSKNITANVPTVTSWDGDVGFVEFSSGFSYNGPSNQLRRIAARVLTTGEILPFPSPCGSNCTYNFTLTGPTYQCLKYDPSLQLPNLTIPGYKDAFDAYPSYTIPYYSVEIVGNDTGDGLWVLYGQPPNSTIHCTLWNATYISNVNFTNNIAEITTTVNGLSQLNSTSIISRNSTYLLLDGSQQNSSNIQPEWEALNTYTIQKAVSSLLQGYIAMAGVFGGLTTKDTMIGVASFVDISELNITFQGSVPELLEGLLINTTLSITNFLSHPALPDLQGETFLSQPAIYTEVPAFVSTYPALYVYNRFPLWIPYGIALGLAAICCITGGFMLWRNGIVGDLTFSHMLVATRNPTLDKLCSETGMTSSEMVTNELKDTRLRYGILPGDEPRLVFGIEEEIITIKKRK